MNRFTTAFRRRALLALALVLAAAPLQAQTASVQASVQAPVPGSELTVYVMTMGPGDLVWERFGHNAIWIHDARRGTDEAYNYGLFDFQQENFLLRFIQGRMLYWMEGFDAERTVQSYAASDRTVWVQELNLTPAQRLELQRFLEWNELPENRFYRYDYYRDNCSTRVRDALDRVLGGALREQTAGVPSGSTYRSHTRRATAEDLPVYTGLEVGLGAPVDQEISLWEEMFLPLRMRQTLRDVMVAGPGGERVPLVRSERVVYQAAREPLPAEPPERRVGYLIAGVVLGGVLALLGRASGRYRGARFGFAALGSLWSLLAGTGGVILAGLWLFTDHQVAYRNENLLQLSPLSLVLVLLLPAAAYGARWAARPGRWAAAAVAALALLGWILQALPGLDQFNGEVIALALPVHLGIAWAMTRGVGAVRPGSMRSREAP